LTRCDKCGAEMPEGANYCLKCGSKLGRVVTEQFSVDSDDLVKKVKDLLHEGNVTKIIVKDEKGNLLLEVPVTASLIGVVLAPWLAALGAIAALVTRCTISVERKE
jgi:CBS domain-containing protein